jgi:hypothetical protein
MVKRISNIRSDVEDFKNILVCDLFYIIALDISKPLLETEMGNKYILVLFYHYSK